MSYGLTPEGFNIKTLPVIESEIDAALKAAFGSSINTTAQSVFGQLKGIFAEREALLWELLQDIYHSQYPAQAAGVSLDNVVGLTAHTRLPAMASRIKGVQVTGTPATVVPQGTLFSPEGNPEAQFYTLEAVTLSATGTATVDCLAAATGPMVVDPGTLTRIVTPISGLTAVTNPTAAIIGRDTETDAELRIRRKDNLQISHAGPTEAIRKAILRLNDDPTKARIGMASVFENNTMAIDPRGLPPKSFEAVVWQVGDVTDRDKEIAETIMLRSKPAGIETHGDVAVEVIDSQGFTHVCRFSRPFIVQIHCILNVVTDTAYPVNGNTIIRDRIVEWGNNHEAGEDIIVYPKLISQLSGIPGITDVTVRIGRAPNPTLDDNVIIDNGIGGKVEMPRFEPANIMVTAS